MSKLEFQGTIFEFSRSTGLGDWYTVSQFNQLPPNCAVPVIFGTELTKAAREQGLKELFNFARNSPAVSTARAQTGTRASTRTQARKSKAGKLKITFNPFASL